MRPIDKPTKNRWLLRVRDRATGEGVSFARAFLFSFFDEEFRIEEVKKDLSFGECTKIWEILGRNEPLHAIIEDMIEKALTTLSPEEISKIDGNYLLILGSHALPGSALSKALGKLPLEAVAH